jgi:flagellar biosynthesis protein FlgN
MDAAAVAALIALLDREIAAGQALLAGLDLERSTLTGFDVAALEAATGEKERLAAEFERLDADRRRLLERFGYGPSETDMVELIRVVEDSTYTENSRRAGPLVTRWRRLVALIQRCRNDNQRNGMIVGLQTRRVTQTLNVLRTGRPDQLTYGRGTHGLASAARALGRA